MIITHSDLDGFVSALVCMQLENIQSERVYTSSYGSNRDKFWERILSDTIGRPTRLLNEIESVWFLDMGLSQGELEWARDQHKQGFWYWVDHHLTSDEYDSEGIFHEAHVITDGSVCASDIMWNLFEEKGMSDPNLQNWVAVAHDRDLWINKKAERNMKLDMVVKAALGREDGFRQLLTQVWKHSYSPVDVLMIYAHDWTESMKEFHKSVEMANKTAQVNRVNDYPVKLCYCSGYASDVSEKLYSKKGDEILGLIQLINTEVVLSLRTRRDDVNMADMAKTLFSGGGHPQAAGGKLNEKHLRGGYIAILRDMKKVLVQEE